MSFYNFSHYMQVWLQPPGLILLMMFCGLLLGLLWPRAGRGLLIAAFVLFWMLSTPVFTQQLFIPLQNQYKPLNVKQASGDDAAIVVLGAGVNSDNTYKRLKYAAALHAKINAPVITSGGNRDTDRSEAEMMRDELMTEYHIQALAMEDKSRNTIEESKLLIPILKRHHIKRIYLVTNAFHMPRSMVAFEASLSGNGIAVIPAPMGYVTLLSNDKIANYLPQANALDASEFAIHEYIGLMWYRNSAVIPRPATSAG